MTNAEDTKREKAKKLRYKKPIARGLNLMTIKEKLYDIQDECEEVHWFWDTVKGRVNGMSEAFCLWHDRKFEELAEWQQEQCEKEGMQCEDCQFLEEKGAEKYE